MSKFIATQIKRNGKEITFTTHVSEYHLNRFIQELQDIDMYDVEVKRHKESRSARQNAMLWAVIEKISIEVNGSKREDDTMKIYQELLTKANVKHVFLAAVKEAKPILEQNFRYVVELPNTQETKKGVELVLYKCYIGSSKFDTKEMTELLDCALDYAHQVGVYDSEIMSIKETYKL